MNISAPHLANVFQYATYRDVPESVLRSYLSDSTLDICNPQNNISEKEFLNVFGELINKTKDEYIGLHYGCFLNIKAMGFINQLTLNTSHIEQAVLILQNYLENSFPLITLKKIKKRGKYILQLESTIKVEKLRKNIADAVYCFIYRELKLIVGDEMLPELQVPDKNLNEYSKFLNCTVCQGEEYRFIFKGRVENEEINKKREKEIELLLPKFLQMLNKKKVGYKKFSVLIRNMILNMCCPELPTFEQVAVQFPLSSRTIQRKLTEEGQSFRKIKDDIKKELSTYLTKDNKMKTRDIACFLGYSGSSAYLHAAQKWK